MAESPLAAFVAYAGRLRGDERGEAQVFLEHLFQAFGHRSLAESGAVLEQRVKRKSGTTGFADLVWPGRLLLEMKPRGEKLQRHYRQVFEYWVRLVPHRPRWVVLCNFDELWIYDFDKQVDEPMDRVVVADLLRRSSAVSFLKPVEEPPAFGVNRLQVTQEAADRVAEVFTSVVGRGVDPVRAQRFVLQCVVAKFSEDLELLPANLFTALLRECLDGRTPGVTAFNLIGGLFTQMNSQRPAGGGRFREVRYFNGGLFAQVDPVELTTPELEHLYRAAAQDWRSVNPAIFGTIFQHSMGDAARHTSGAHFTSEADILKVVQPTIVRPWQERIEGAESLRDLLALHEALREFKVLDPACGSGNFLYVAFRELKRLETDLILKVRPFKKSRRSARIIGRERVSTRQMYGLDTLPFAVELAKVTLLLAKELSLVEQQEALAEDAGWIDFDPDLPLDNLDTNVRQGDALFEPWPAVHAVIGNPPYQSKNKMQSEFGRAYLNRLRAAFPLVPGRADYCVYFFRKAHDALPSGGRAGLVGTNTIRQNYSREGGLDHIVATGGTITDAVSTQHWSGDAAVHVSIVNWTKATVPGAKRLSWQAEDGAWSSIEVQSINSSLSPRTDLSSARRLKACSSGLFCAQGQTHGHDGFLLARPEAEALFLREPSSAEVLFPFLTAEELLASADGCPHRYVIDFHPRDLFGAQRYGGLFQRVRAKVLPDRESAAADEERRNAAAVAESGDARVNRHHRNFLARWWLLAYPRENLMQLLAQRERYIACARVTKRPIFAFIGTDIHPNDALAVFPLPDDYSFGILQSSLHWSWFTERCSTLKGDFRYTSDSVFDTFPWPQSPSRTQVRAVADAAVELRRTREALQRENGLSLRDLYRLAEQPGENRLRTVQERLDAAVAVAYGMGERAKRDPLAFLLELNLRLAEAEARGERVVGPGLPPRAGPGSGYVTADCIRMP